MDGDEQRLHYSGKKKLHTAKTLVITSKNKRIEVMTPVYYGSCHDFSIYKEERIYDLLPSRTPIYVDTGFEGICSYGENLNIRKPKKKRKNKKLNGGEKLGNRIISRTRVTVEHAIGGMKIFRIASDKFRGINRSMNITLSNAAGLWNLKVGKRFENQHRKSI